MFSKPGQPPLAGAGRESGRSVISSDVQVEGSLSTDGFLEFDGRIVGDLSAQALGVGRAALVKGNVAGAFVTVDGTVEGDISAGTLTLKPSSVVQGAISYGTLTVESGATVNGHFRRLPEPVAEVLPAEAGAATDTGTGTGAGDEAGAASGEAPALGAGGRG